MVRPRFVRAGPAAIALEAALAPVIVLAAATAPVAGVPAIVLAAAVAVKKLQLVRLAAGSPVQARVPLAAVATMPLPAAVAAAAPLRPRRHAVIRA